MNIQRRRDVISKLDQLRTSVLNRSPDSKRDEITNEAQVGVLEACTSLVLTNQVTDLAELGHRLERWRKVALQRQNAAQRRGYSGEVVRMQGASSACVAALSLL